ncbi:N-acetylglucosamine-6-phosphate deacetylase [Microbacterium sp. AG1240]|uniref:N-acetylglucosamine-6-phosphate deacetylase n=1 Tax=Microbacterium sp. AG1240 TaxID=2183992 RepID=UPI000F25AD1A|nr:amidohydrolase family protein [Microbacterium sp. AG1240]RKT31501.1 N-acetylglucosamine-6-phosphate deacetylase [Microbacterium sp. AG1240]
MTEDEHPHPLTVYLEATAPTGERGWFETRDGVVTARGTGSRAPEPGQRCVPLSTAVVTTGFTDLHCHGASGVAFDAGPEGAIREAIDFHGAHGTGRMLLSLVSAPVPRLAARLAEISAALPSLPAAAGIHAEGPFLAPGRRGAHAAAALTDPSPQAVEALLEAANGRLRSITIAPELPGAIDAIDRLTAAGVVVAVGHTDADYDRAAEAFDHGASLLTHTFNAMRPFLHREPGPIGAAIDRDHVVLEAIADGHHLHDAALRLLFAAAPGRIALVTDAMSATGCADGEFAIGELDVTVRGGVPYLSGTTTLAGSTLTLDEAVRRCVRAGIPVTEAVAAAASVPAALLGEPEPRVDIGARTADLLVVHQDGSVEAFDAATA